MQSLCKITGTYSRFEQKIIRLDWRDMQLELKPDPLETIYEARLNFLSNFCMISCISIRAIAAAILAM